jgi:hypothetical protein
MSLFHSKKFWVSSVGLIVAVLAANGVALPTGLEDKIVQLIMVIVGGYNIGQGISDAGTKGATSGVAAYLGKQSG